LELSIDLLCGRNNTYFVYSVLKWKLSFSGFERLLAGNQPDLHISVTDLEARSGQTETWNWKNDHLAREGLADEPNVNFRASFSAFLTS